MSELENAGSICETVSPDWSNLGELESDMSVAATDLGQMYSALSGYPLATVLPPIPQVGGN